MFFFSQLRTEDRNRKMPCEVWLLSVSHCLPESLLDPISPASLLCCYADTKCISFFSWGLVKCIFLLKNISSFLVLSHQWWTQSFPSSWMYKIICPAMPDSPCLIIQEGGGRTTNQKSSPDILVKLSRIKNWSLGCSKAPNSEKSLFYCCVPFTVILLWLIYFVYIYLQIPANISRSHLDHVLQNYCRFSSHYYIYCQKTASNINTGDKSLITDEMNII